MTNSSSQIKINKTRKWLALRQLLRASSVLLFCLLTTLMLSGGLLHAAPEKKPQKNNVAARRSAAKKNAKTKTVRKAKAAVSSTRNPVQSRIEQGASWFRRQPKTLFIAGGLGALGLLGALSYARRPQAVVPQIVPPSALLEENARLLSLLDHHQKSQKEREDMYWKMAMNATDVLYVIRPGDDTIEWYGQIDKMLGYAQNSFPRTIEAWAESIHPDESEHILELYIEASRNGGEFQVEYRMRHRNGKYRDWFHRGRPVLSERKELLYFIGACSDVTERNRAQKKLRDSEERLARILEINADAIVLCDCAGRITFANRAAELLFGTGRDNIVGQPYDGGNWKITDSKGEALPPDEQPLAKLLASQDNVAQVEHSIHLQNDKITVVWVNGAPLHDEKGAISGAVLSITDITGRKLAEERLAWQAFHDPLTKLPNRALFMDRLSHALVRAARSNTMIAVFFLDLDNFKKTNDTLGHDAGDDLLKTTAQRLQQSLRNSDTAARLGGDEFVLLLENVGEKANVQMVADRVLESLMQPVLLKGQSVLAPPSIGVAMSTLGCTPDELLAWADTAMYVAKTNGKARYEFHEQDLSAPPSETEATAIASV